MNTTTQNNPIPEPTARFGLSVLPHWGLILVSGEDSTGFLQNQLSNSVLGLKTTKPTEIAQNQADVRLVGYCSPKGRLLASAWLANYQQGDINVFALFISRDIAASFAKRLSMFVLRSKVVIQDVSNDWGVFGSYDDGQHDHRQIQADELVLRLPSVLANGKSYGRTLIAKPNPIGQFSSSDDDSLALWNDLEVLSAIPRIVAATQEQFVPQMINFESVAGVDFKKGCYPGQEIVARSQYRGVIKRRLQLAHIVDESLSLEAAKPGTELFHQDDPSQPSGMVVLSARSPISPPRLDLQIECKLEALERGEIRLGSIDGPVLKIDALPYPLLEI